MGGENTEYGADQIQILEGLSRTKETRYVYRKYIRQRSSSSGL